MSFLVGLVANLMEWLFGKIFSFFKEEEEIREENAQLKKQAQDDAEKLKAAKTLEDKEHAAETIIDHSFKP